MKKLIIFTVLCLCVSVFSETTKNWSLIANRCRELLKETRERKDFITYADNISIYETEIVKHEILLKKRVPITHYSIPDTEKLENLKKIVEIIISNEIYNFGDTLFVKEGRQIIKSIKMLMKGKETKFLPKEIKVMLAYGKDYDGLQAMLITSFMPSHPVVSGHDFIPISTSTYWAQLEEINSLEEIKTKTKIADELDFAKVFNDISSTENFESNL